MSYPLTTYGLSNESLELTQIQEDIADLQNDVGNMQVDIGIINSNLADINSNAYMKNQDVTINSPNTQLATYVKTINGLNGNEIANVNYVNSQTSSSMNTYWSYGGGTSMIPSNYNILVPSPFTTTFQIPPTISNAPVYSKDAVY